MKKVFSEFFTHAANVYFSLFALGLLVAAVAVSPATILRSLWVVLIPPVLAPFVEWVLHKYALHRIVDPAKDPRGYAYMLKLHYKHHWEPTKIPYVFAPASGPITIFVVFLPLGAAVFRDPQQALLFGFAVVTYFLTYEWLHLAHHIPSYRAITAYGKLIRNAHSWHHYKNENFWWGVSNPLGDYLFGTFKDPKEVEFSPSAKSLDDLEKTHKK